MTPTVGAYAAFRLPDYRRLITVWFLIGLTHRMQVVALGWHLYERTGSAMAIAWIGFAQFVPMFLFALPAGALADRHDRRLLLIASVCVSAFGGGLLALAGALDASDGWLYLGSFIGATGQVLNRPARSALLPSVVPLALLPGAVAWSAGINQVAAVAGPALAGLLIAATGEAVTAYWIVAGGNVLALLFAARMASHPLDIVKEQTTRLRHLLAGMVHIVKTPVILGSVSLDMLQVMFSGATGLLPIYAKDILQVGPSGLGWLASAPAVGAIVTVFLLNHLPSSSRPGARFLWAVAGYGAVCAVFGLSTELWLSLAALAVMGALNSISVVTRQTVLQAYTPVHLRGRVASAAGIFSGAASELGQFEAGALAALTSPVFTVVAGGCFTLALAGYTARRFPELRTLRSLTLN